MRIYFETSMLYDAYSSCSFQLPSIFCQNVASDYTDSRAITVLACHIENSDAVGHQPGGRGGRAWSHQPWKCIGPVISNAVNEEGA